MAVAAMAFSSMAWAIETTEVQTSEVVLTRGPVHEAFAEPQTLDPNPGLIVETTPPPPVNEVIPAQKPADPTSIWIPGYWSWDEDENHYIWISGIWRIPPPGEVWVSGYWSDLGDGRFQWVQGFWQPETVEQIQYYPQPPRTLAVEMPEAPDPNSVWVPGTWRYVDEEWLWEPGRWIRPVENWVWVPSHWVWSPSGYVFVRGFWDYEVPRRGLVFAPVYYPRPVYTERQYVYTPSVVIHTEAIVSNLFVRPKYDHYYFGDYYEDRYQTRGIVPIYFSVRERGWYDPIFYHERWRHRDNERDWLQRYERDYDYRRLHVDARPPHTYVDQVAMIRGRGEINQTTIGQQTNIFMGSPITEIVNNQNVRNTTINNTTVNNTANNVNNTTVNNIQIVQLSPERREQLVRANDSLRTLRDERVRLESQSRGAGAAEGQVTVSAKPLSIAPAVTTLREVAPVAATEQGRGTNGQNAPGEAATAAGATGGVPRQDIPPAQPEVVRVAPTPAGVKIATPGTTEESGNAAMSNRGAASRPVSGGATPAVTPSAPGERATPAVTPEAGRGRSNRGAASRPVSGGATPAVTPSAPGERATPAVTPTGAPESTPTPASDGSNRGRGRNRGLTNENPNATPNASPEQTPAALTTPAPSESATPTPATPGRGRGGRGNRGQDRGATPAVTPTEPGTSATPAVTPSESPSATPSPASDNGRGRSRSGNAIDQVPPTPVSSGTESTNDNSGRGRGQGRANQGTRSSDRTDIQRVTPTSEAPSAAVTPSSTPSTDRGNGRGHGNSQSGGRSIIRPGETGSSSAGPSATPAATPRATPKNDQSTSADHGNGRGASVSSPGSGSNDNRGHSEKITPPPTPRVAKQEEKSNDAQTNTNRNDNGRGSSSSGDKSSTADRGGSDKHADQAKNSSKQEPTSMPVEQSRGNSGSHGHGH